MMVLCFSFIHSERKKERKKDERERKDKCTANFLFTSILSFSFFISANKKERSNSDDFQKMGATKLKKVVSFLEADI